MEIVLQRNGIDQNAFFSSGLFAASETFWRENSTRTGTGGEDQERANSEDKRSGTSGTSSANAGEQGASTATQQPTTDDDRSTSLLTQPASLMESMDNPTLTQGVSTKASGKGVALPHSESYLATKQTSSEAHKMNREPKRNSNADLGATGKLREKRKKEEEIKFCWQNEDACDHIKEIIFNV